MVSVFWIFFFRNLFQFVRDHFSIHTSPKNGWRSFVQIVMKYPAGDTYPNPAAVVTRIDIAPGTTRWPPPSYISVGFAGDDLILQLFTEL